MYGFHPISYEAISAIDEVVGSRHVSAILITIDAIIPRVFRVFIGTGNIYNVSWVINPTNVIITVVGTYVNEITGTPATRTSIVTSHFADAVGVSYVELPSPRINSFSPTHGLPNNIITLNGIGFNGVNKVKVGKFNAAFTVNNDTGMMVTIPAGATTGFFSVFDPNNGGARSLTRFVVD